MDKPRGGEEEEEWDQERGGELIDERKDWTRNEGSRGTNLL